MTYTAVFIPSKAINKDKEDFFYITNLKNVKQEINIFKRNYMYMKI